MSTTSSSSIRARTPVQNSSPLPAGKPRAKCPFSSTSSSAAQTPPAMRTRSSQSLHPSPASSSSPARTPSASISPSSSLARSPSSSLARSISSTSPCSSLDASSPSPDEDLIDDPNLLCKGIDKITDTGKRSFGTSQNKLDLFDGKYKMGLDEDNVWLYEDNVMIKKKAGLTKKDFNILNTFAHPNAMPILNYYSEPKSTNMGRFIIPPVHDSFQHWYSEHGRTSFFDHNGIMKTFFRNFIIDMCDLVQSLKKENILIPEGITKDNIYVKISCHSVPRFMVLITKAEPSLFSQNEHLPVLQTVRELIDWCCESSEVKLDLPRISFADFIMKPMFTVEKLRQYPDEWDWETKGEYLMFLKSEDLNSIKRDLRKAGVAWPCPIPEELDKMLDAGAKQNHLYNKNVPVDYVIALWDSYKHFQKLGLHRIFREPQSLVKMIDDWTPTLWVDLYEVTGWC